MVQFDQRDVVHRNRYWAPDRSWIRREHHLAMVLSPLSLFLEEAKLANFDRRIFYINLPVIGLGMVFVILFLHQAKIPGHILEKLGRFDWFGSFLFTASSTGFLFGLTTGGVIYDWDSWRVLLPLLVGLAGMVVFGWYEVKIATEPIISRGIFTNWDLVKTYVMTVFHGMILWSLLYFLRKFSTRPTSRTTF